MKQISILILVLVFSIGCNKNQAPASSDNDRPKDSTIVKVHDPKLLLLKNEEALIKQSLEYSFSNYPAISGYVKSHAQAMSEDVMRQHIDLYVNSFSLNLGEKGLDAVNTMHKIYEAQSGVISAS